MQFLSFRPYVGAALAALGLSLSIVSAAAGETPAGFTALFDGKPLTGWHGMPHFDPRELWKLSPEERAKKEAGWQEEFKAHWSIKDGELINDGKGPYATTDKEYKNFELYLEYRTVAKADSGIYLRGNPQVQIWDSTEKAKFNLGADKGSGALWNNSPGAPGKDPLVLADKPFGEWNSFKITIVSNYVTVHFNGQLTVDDAVMENYWDRTQPLWAQGPLQLQTHGGEIRWRKIFLREIGDAEAAPLIKEAAAKAAKAKK